MGCQPLSAHMLGTHLIPILSNGHSHPRHLQLTLPYRESDVIYATNLKRVCFLTLLFPLHRLPCFGLETAVMNLRQLPSD